LNNINKTLRVIGILSLLCGIISIFPGILIVPLWPYFPGAAIILGIIGITYEVPKNMAIVGLTLGIIALLALPIVFYGIYLPLFD